MGKRKKAAAGTALQRRSRASSTVRKYQARQAKQQEGLGEYDPRRLGPPLRDTGRAVAEYGKSLGQAAPRVVTGKMGAGKALRRAVRRSKKTARGDIGKPSAKKRTRVAKKK